MKKAQRHISLSLENERRLDKETNASTLIDKLLNDYYNKQEDPKVLLAQRDNRLNEFISRTSPSVLNSPAQMDYWANYTGASKSELQKLRGEKVWL